MRKSTVKARTSAGKKDTTQPVTVIFDTDVGPDCDDVGAITLLHYYEKEGKAKILATITSTKYPRVAAVLSVLNNYFKKHDIPIGVPKGDALTTAEWQHWSDTLVAKYSHKIKIVSSHENRFFVSLCEGALTGKQPVF